MEDFGTLLFHPYVINCCCLPTPLTLVCGGGGSDHPASGSACFLHVLLAVLHVCIL